MNESEQLYLDAGKQYLRSFLSEPAMSAWREQTINLIVENYEEGFINGFESLNEEV